MPKFQRIHLTLLVILASFFPVVSFAQSENPYAIGAPSTEQLAYYDLDPDFYKKSIFVQDILIATSENVSDFALKESAYLFDKIMNSINPHVAQRIRDQKLLCLLIGWNEQTSDLPQYQTELTGEKKDFYNWRKRGFLSKLIIDDRRQPVVVFAEEDVLEYPGGMLQESILVHEFGHVIMFQGFSETQMKQVTGCFENAKVTGLYNDGYAAQRFKRVQGSKPIQLIDSLTESFPGQSRKLLQECLKGGDITVNGKPTTPSIMVSEDDRVLIHFGGPKPCYAVKNRSEYWAEIAQTWFDTNRTMDHDHNHVHTRVQLKDYDPMGAALCEEVLGDGQWRFVSPRIRAGTDHLDGFDPGESPNVTQLPNIKEAGLDYYDEYWEDYWQRLQNKYSDTP